MHGICTSSDCPRFCLPGNTLIYASKLTLLDTNVLTDRCFLIYLCFSRTSSVSFHYFLVSLVSAESPLFMTSYVSFADFKFLSLCLDRLSLMCLSMDHSEQTMLRLVQIPWMCRFMYFTNFKKVSATTVNVINDNLTNLK